MKLIAGQCYLDVSDCIKCGISKDANYINKEKSRGAKWANFIKDPQDNRITLIEFNSLKEDKKQKVLQHFGNPYELLSKQPICDLVIKDINAEKFYTEYRYDDKKSLPKQTIESYTIAASWLNMLVNAESDKKILKQQLNLSITQFWIKVCEIITAEKIDLPSSIIRLRQKIDLYKKEGYSCLIDKHFGMRNAAKVDCEVSQSVLLELIAMPYQDDVMTARRYNIWAEENGKKQITDSTVRNWRVNNLHLISSQKYGNKKTYNTFGKHIIRKRPSAPLLLVEHDDNEIDLYFQFRKKGGVFYYNRYVIAVVVDAFNDYILGWAIAEEYTKDLIRFAYLDAMHHIKELTGAWYLPYQIRSDRFGLNVNADNDLGQFYKSLAIYTPAAVQNARGKYIERSFGTQWHQALAAYSNYAGMNITSSKNRIVEEHRDIAKKNYPTTDKAPGQIAGFINTMRHLVTKSGMSRQEEWINAFNENEKSKQRNISDTQMLLKLGTKHDYLNTITNRGITPAINCIERTYEIPEEHYLETIGRKVQVIFDPMDFSRILVTNDQNLLFIAKEQQLMPSAIADFEPGDRAKINDRLEEKKRHMKTINAAKEKRQNTLEKNRINAESLLQAGVHTKAINHKALIEYNPGNNERRSLEDMVKKM